MVHKGPRPEHRRQTVGRPYRRLQEHVFTEETCCCRCGREVDKALPYRDPTTGRVNVWSKSLEHLIPVVVRPDLALVRSNARLAHLRCNTSYGDGTKRARKASALVMATRW